MPKAMSLSELTSYALALLCKELGVANTLRFLNQYTQGTGDYTAERQHLFKDLTLSEYKDTLATLKQHKP